MTTETWTPDSSLSPQDKLIDQNFLKTIAEKLEENGHLDISCMVTPQEKEKNRTMMQLSEKEWTPTLENISNSNIIALIKFFTLAEKEFSGWQGNEKSPVIYLAKALRRRGETLDKDLLHWIKANSDNKFLPYGPL